MNVNFAKLFPHFWNTYEHMMCRCGLWSPKYFDTHPHHKEHYFDRGITVCDAWRVKGGFLRFCVWAVMNDWFRGAVIDRIDNDRGYSPENCRWVTWGESNRNRRMTEKMLAANRRNAAKGNAVQAAMGHPELVKARAVLAARRASCAG